MADTLTARLLDRRTIDKAYPLVRNIVPGMTAVKRGYQTLDLIR